MSPKNQLDDRMNGLMVAVVIALSIGLSISVFGPDAAQVAGGARAVATNIAAPASQVTAMLMAQQMPR